MLNELSVKNFALIEELSLSFGSSFNVLTGETGAGKSIIVGAINLILGGRAFTELIREGADEAEVQALFLPADPEALGRRLEELGLPAGDEIVLRRVISRAGRNRVYINGSLATLTQLTTLTRDLVSVSGQHEHQQLLDPERQLLLVDQFGDLRPRRAEMSEMYGRSAELKARLAALEKDLQEGRRQVELTRFQVQEIEAVGLRPGEDEDLDQERRLVRNAEKIYSLVKGSFDRLYGEAGSAIELLDAARTDLEKAVNLDHRLTAVLAQIDGAYHELDDAARTLREHLDKITFDPRRLEDIEDRLALISRLKRKYGPTLDDVLDYGRRAAEQLGRLEDLELERERLRSQAEKSGEQAKALARELSEKRRAAALKLAEAAARELRTLGMPGLEFSVSFSAGADQVEPGPLGWDQVEFLISPNIGEELKPLARIASGGELSRVMLCLKSLLAGQERVQTIIFDEVDAGIGGAVAEVIGRKIKDLSGFHQVVCITHLPQIAVFGQNHHLVYKEVRGRRTVTDIRPLQADEKTVEIARMLGGVALTAKTLEAAREMVERASSGSDAVR